MGWVMYKTHGGLNTYENDSLEPSDTFKILRFIKNKYGEHLKSDKEFWNIITDDIYNDLILFCQRKTIWRREIEVYYI